MAAKKRKRVTNPQPSPMAVRLGMSDDWALTIWSPKLKRYVHFIFAALGQKMDGYALVFCSESPINAEVRTWVFDAPDGDGVEAIEEYFDLW